MSDSRWRRVALVRLALTALAVIGLSSAPTASPPALWGPLVAAYVVGVIVLEADRRRRRSRGEGLIMPLVLLDGTMIALAMADSGGTASPLEVLVVLQVVAMALTVSGRTGLEAAVWQATLLLVVTAPTRSEAAWEHAAAYVVAGAVVAAFAAVDARGARRRRDRLAAQIRLMARLEPVVTVEEACAALAAQVTAAGFRRCAVLITSADEVVGAVDEGGQAPVLVAAPPPLEQGRLLAAVGDGAPALARFLDPVADPLLDRLLPGAMNVVGVPILVDGRALGVAVAEWRPGLRARIPDAAVDGLRGDADHCGRALRAVLLLEQVEQRSRRDLLTGLANRRGFDEALDRELSRIDRTAGALSLALIDLDHFKVVNDTQGHQAGDRVLAAVGAVIGSTARGHDLPARIGGDEFALLLPDCGSAAAGLVVDRVLTAVASAVGHLGVTASVGVASAPGNGRTRGGLVRAADEALYAAKAAGRNRSVLSRRRSVPAGAVLVLDDAGPRGRPHRRADLQSRVLYPAGPEA